MTAFCYRTTLLTSVEWETETLGMWAVGIGDPCIIHKNFVGFLFNCKNVAPYF